MMDGHARRGAALTVGALVLGSMVLGGCVSHTRHDDAVRASRAQQEEITRLSNEVKQAQSEAEIERQQRQRAEQANAELLQRTRALEDELEGLGADLSAFQQRLASAQMIDPTTSRALAQLARQHPDLVTYDATRGMLRFSSDLTFDSGSDAVKEGAKASLAALAQVLQTQSAAAYEVQIIGHTDAQPIGAGTAQRHPTNMHLSCHRAISVRRELVRVGVPAGRVMAAGWGEHHPIAPSGPGGNTPQNRRVEIYLLPARTGGSIAGAPTGGTAPDRDSPPTRQPDINK